MQYEQSVSKCIYFRMNTVHTPKEEIKEINDFFPSERMTGIREPLLQQKAIVSAKTDDVRIAYSMCVRCCRKRALKWVSSVIFEQMLRGVLGYYSVWFSVCLWSL